MIAIHKTYMHEKNEYNVYIKVPQERRENEKFNNKMYNFYFLLYVI